MDFTIQTIDKIRNNLSILKMLEGKDNTYSEYYWCRRSVEYIIRLMYAITVDLVIQTNPNKANKVLLDVKDGNLGAYHTSANGGLISALPYELQHEFREYWKILKLLTITRNEDAHEGTSPNDLEPYIVENKKQFEELENITKKKFFSFTSSDSVHYYYLSVPNKKNLIEDEEIFCTRIDENGNIDPIKVKRDRLMRGNDILYNQLYLCVVTLQSAEFYRLSPFIGLDDNILNSLYISPTMYMGVIQYWDNKVDVEHRRILDDQKEDLYKKEVTCDVNTLIPRVTGKNCKFCGSIITNNKKNIDINLSEYPGYSKITSGNYPPYYEDICPAVKDAIDFCIKRPESYQIICGDGGLGKTALIFHLIHDVIFKGKTAFTRIIFLSAKKYFRYTDKEINALEQETQIIPDIDNYQEFLEKMAQYIYDDETLCHNTKENDLLDKINGKTPGKPIPNTFLVVDDLDTLTKEDQDKVINFLRQINPKKMNALITTREKRTNGYRITLTKLDKHYSLLFLKWCIDQEKDGYGQQVLKNQDSDVFYNYTEGRPLDIKLWSNLIIRGFDAPKVFYSYWTKRQRTMYLYQTTLNQISETEQLFFKLLCYIREELCLEDSNPAIPKTLMRYLYPWKSENDIDNIIQDLSDVRLVTTKNESIFIEDIDYLELLENASVEDLPEYHQKIIEDIRNAPGEWLGYAYKKRLLKYLANRLSEENHDYERAVLKRLSEDKKYLTGTELKLVVELMQKQGRYFCTPTVATEKSMLSSNMKALKQLENELNDAVERVLKNPKDGLTEDKVLSVFNEICKMPKATLNKAERELFEKIRKQFMDNGLSDYVE